MNGLDDLIPQGRHLSVGGREVHVLPLKMRQVPGFLKAIANPWTAIVTEQYLAAVMEWPDELTEAVSIATGLEATFLQDLTPDDFLRLGTAVFEVNLDFFAKAVLPQTAAMGKAMQQAFLKPSASQPGSSKPDTATRTSSTTPLPN